MEAHKLADMEDFVLMALMDITKHSRGGITARREGGRAWSAWVELDAGHTDRVRRMCIAHGTTKGRAERACLAEALRWLAATVEPKPSKGAKVTP